MVIILGILIVFGIIDLVRRRKLNEEYSFLWLIIGVILLLITFFPHIIEFISGMFGTELPINTLFFTGIIFLMLLGLFFSLKISILSNRVKKLSQKIAILEFEIKKNKNTEKNGQSEIKNKN